MDIRVQKSRALRTTFTFRQSSKSLSLDFFHFSLDFFRFSRPLFPFSLDFLVKTQGKNEKSQGIVSKSARESQPKYVGKSSKTQGFLIVNILPK